MTTITSDNPDSSASPVSRRVALRLLGGGIAGAVAGPVLGALNATSAAAAPACGQILVDGGSWLQGTGVDVRSNGPYQATGSSCTGWSTSNPAAQNGYGWQCVELASRLYAVKGWGTIRTADGGARSIPEGSAGMQFFANGSGYRPVPGDLIIHHSASFGHVSVVDYVQGGTIFAVEQNSSASGRTTYSFDGATIRGGSGTIRGCVHAPTNVRSGGSSIAVARNRDGRLEIFGVNHNQGIFQRWQKSPGGSLSGWVGVGGKLVATAAEANADGRLEQMGVNANDDIYRRWQTSPGGAWSGWHLVSGKLTAVAMARNADGRLEAFGANRSGNIYHSWQTSPGGSWSVWKQMPGRLRSIVVERGGDGRLEAYGTNDNDDIFHCWQTSPSGGWSTWKQVPGKLSQVAMGRNRDGRLEIYGTNHLGNIYTKWQWSVGGGWSGWNLVGGKLVSVAVEANADGRLEVWGVNGNRRIYRRWQTSPGGSWTGWQSMDGQLRP